MQTQNNYAYITVLSTDDYLLGLLVLYKSLMKTAPKYPFYCLISENISEKTQSIIHKSGIQTIDFKGIAKIKFPQSVIEGNANFNAERWNNTFEKLSIFELVQFDKLVFLDSDMMILSNIDKLFDYQCFSATNAGCLYPGNEDWKDLSSAIFVCEPQEGYLKKFAEILPELIKEKKHFGDQDVLQLYFKDWKNRPELNFGEGYNVFACYLDYYIRKLGFRLQNPDTQRNISVVHFVGYPKPWMYADGVSNRMVAALKYNVLRYVNKNSAAYLKALYKKMIRDCRKIKQSVDCTD